MNTSNEPATSIFRAAVVLNVAPAGSSETLVSTYQTIQHHTLEDKYSELKTVTNLQISHLCLSSQWKCRG
jgi:hypothetical protein